MILPSSDIGRGGYLLLCRSGSLYRGQYQSVCHRDDYASPALMATLYWGGMLVGRLVGSSLSRISPRVQLTVTTVSAGLLALLAILLNNPWLLTAVGLFHSIMWGAIFTLSVAHLGKYTSVASGVFMIGVVAVPYCPCCKECLPMFLEAGDGHGSSFFLEKRLCCIMH